jgi:hypothetical protein
MMDFDRARKGMMIGIAVISCAFAYYFHVMQRKTMDQFMEAERGPGMQAFDAEEAQTRLADLKQTMDKAADALAQQDEQTASTLFQKHYNHFDGLYSHGEERLASGQTLKEAYDAIFESYATHVLSAFDSMIKAALEGEIDPLRVQRFSQHHGSLLPELTKRYQQERKTIEASRARLASTWFRVVIQDSSDDWRADLEQAFRNKWNPDLGMKLVFGSPLGSLERKATWRELKVTTKLSHARYSDTGKGWGDVQIPQTLEVTFLTLDKNAVPTSWDELLKLTLSVEVPSSIERRSDGSYDEARTWTTKNMELLRKEMIAGLAVLPEFDIYPGIDPATLKLVKDDGRLDKEAATILSLKAPGLLRGHFKTVMDTANPALRSDLIQFVISHQQETFLPWLTDTLKEADERTRFEAMEVLRDNPWFGDYEPLLILLEQSNEQTLHKGLQSLYGQLDNEKVADVLKRKSEDRENTTRRFFAELYIREIPQEKLAEISSWIQDPDVEFASRAYQELLRRDKKLGEDLVIKTLHLVPDPVKMTMLSGLRLHEDTFAQSGLIPRVVSLAQQTENQPLSERAESCLISSCSQPEVWQALRSLHDSEAVLHDRLAVYSALVYQARNANQGTLDEAMAWLDQQIDTSQKQIMEGLADAADSRSKTSLRRLQDIRNQAIGHLFQQPGPWDAQVRRLHQLYTAYPSDESLCIGIAQALGSNANKGGWVHDQNEYRALLEALVIHDHKNVRGPIYNALGHSAGKGWQQYRTMLEDALGREQDQYLKRSLESILSRLR